MVQYVNIGLDINLEVSKDFSNAIKLFFKEKLCYCVKGKMYLNVYR